MGVLEEGRMSLERHAYSIAGPVVDLRPESLEQMHNLFEIDVGADGMGE
jgi:hypothetical protein